MHRFFFCLKIMKILIYINFPKGESTLTKNSFLLCCVLQNQKFLQI